MLTFSIVVYKYILIPYSYCGFIVDYMYYVLGVCNFLAFFFRALIIIGIHLEHWILIVVLFTKACQTFQAFKPWVLLTYRYESISEWTLDKMLYPLPWSCGSCSCNLINPTNEWYLCSKKENKIAIMEISASTLYEVMIEVKIEIAI